jgi:hypothetical protein
LKKYNTQLNDSILKTKVETRAQFLFDSMMANWIEPEKIESSQDSTTDSKLEDKQIRSFWDKLHYLPLFEEVSKDLFKNNDTLFKVVIAKSTKLSESESHNYLKLLEKYGSLRYNQITASDLSAFETSYILAEMLRIYITFQFGHPQIFDDICAAFVDKNNSRTDLKEKDITAAGFKSHIPEAKIQELDLKPGQFDNFCWNLLHLNIFKILAGDDEEILPALLNRLPNDNFNVKEIIDMRKLRESVNELATILESDIYDLFTEKNNSSGVKVIFAKRAQEILNCLIQNTKIFDTLLSGALFPHTTSYDRRYLSFVTWPADPKEFQYLTTFENYANSYILELSEEAERIKISKLIASYVYLKVEANIPADLTQHEIKRVRSLILEQYLNDLIYYKAFTLKPTSVFDPAAETAATKLLSPTREIKEPLAKYRELYTEECLKYIKDSERDQFCSYFTYFALCKRFKELFISPQEAFGDEIYRIFDDNGKCLLESAEVTKILEQLESNFHKQALRSVGYSDLKKFNDESFQMCIVASKVSERHMTEAEIKAKKETEVSLRKLAEEKAKIEAQEKDRKDAEEKARRESEEKARREAEEKARKEVEEKARKEADERVKKEAAEKARKEAEEKARKEAEENARKEAEEKAKIDADEKARKEPEEKTNIEREQTIKDAAEKDKMEQKEREQVIKEADGTEQNIQEEAGKREKAEEDEVMRQADLKAQEEAKKTKEESKDQPRKETEESKNSPNKNTTPDNRKAIKIALSIFGVIALIGGPLAAYYFYGKRPTPSVA